MRPILIVSGVLGGGSALVFAVAALVSTLFPNGTLVATNPWNSDVRFLGGPAKVMPAIGQPLIIDDTGSGGSGDFAVPPPDAPNGAANGGDVVAIPAPGPTD